MNSTEWLLKFWRYQNMATLEKVYENLSYTGAPDDKFAMKLAYDRRKAELVAGKLFDHVPKQV